MPRQRVARILHEQGISVQPRGAGRPRRAADSDAPFPVWVLAELYQDRRMTCTQISALTGIPARTVRDRLVGHGVRMRTKGRLNREDRVDVDRCLLADLYVGAGMPAAEIGQILGVSRRVVLRAAHDDGLPVRLGGPPPEDGPEDIELIRALYADPGVCRVLVRHGLAPVPAGGPIWQRFPFPARVSAELAAELYQGCGLATTHIELLTGQPAASITRLLRTAGVPLRTAGGRSPFLRHWRAGAAEHGSPGALTARMAG
jgi:hypothetical protein